MNIDGTFLPVAQELIDSVFPTAINYLRDGGSSYDPATGTVTPNTTLYEIAAELRPELCRYHHGTGGMPELPTTSDRVEYAGLTWKVTVIDPTYSSKGLIASKIVCRTD